MSGDSPHNILNNQEAGGARPQTATNPTSTSALAMASIMPNSVGGSPGVESALAAQINPNTNPNSMGQLPSNQGQMQQNLAVSTFQQGLQGQAAQLMGQQQKAGILRQQQQIMMVSAALASSSSPSSQQNMAVMGSNPMQSPTGMHRSASVPRLSQSQQYNSRSPTFYGNTQLPFNHPLHQQQQQLGALGRTTMMGQGQGVGHLSILSGQPNQFNIQSQVFQARQKQAQMQNSQFQQSVSSGQPLQGMQTIGMMNQLGLASQNRMNAYTQQRVTQGTLRSHSPSTAQQQSLSSPQKIQTQNLPRVPSLGSINSQLTGLSQNSHSSIVPNSLAHNQQWSKMQQSNLASSASPSYQFQQQQRQQHSQLQQQPPPSPSQQQLTCHPQQLSQQQHSPQLQQQHIQQSLPPQQMHRGSSLTGQRPSTPTGSQPGTPASSAPPISGTNNQGTEGSTLFLGKRSIQDLVAQVDPNETADPELVDFLSELADDFINSATEWGLTYAKHRNSTILDDKDMHLHLVKNYKLSLPGFTSKESNKKARLSGSEAHLQRLNAIQKSTSVPQTDPEAVVNKGCTGPFTGSSNSGVQVAKAMQNLAQTFPLPIGSPGVQKITRF